MINKLIVELSFEFTFKIRLDLSNSFLKFDSNLTRVHFKKNSTRIESFEF